MGKRNLANQFIFAVSEMRAHGDSKRADRGNGVSEGKIYSNSYAKDLRTFSKTLGQYLKAEFPELRNVCDITPAQLERYLNRDGVADSTRQKELSYIRKIDIGMKKAFGHGFSGNLSDIDLRMEGTAKMKNRAADWQDAARICLQMRKSERSESWKAVQLSVKFGLRVEECASVRCNGRLTEHGGRWGYGYISLRGKLDGCKGGRPRTIDIKSAQELETAQKLFKGHSAGTVIQKPGGEPLKADSVAQSVRRAVKALGLDWEKENCMHPFRKLFAQATYDFARKHGATKKEAENYAIEQLGHGRNRPELVAVYIKDRW